MTGRGTAGLLAVMFVAAAVLSGCRPLVPGLHVDAFDVTLEVRPDGSVEAFERIVVRSDTPAIEFERTVRNPQADELVFESASIDGRDVSPGVGTPGITVTAGRSLSAHWRFEPAASARTLTLRYRAIRAVGVMGDHGYLRWPVLASPRGYPIASTRVVFAIPADATLYATAVVEPGWTAARQANGITATAANIAANDGASLQAEFSVNPKGMTESDWQLNADRAFQLSFAWVSGGLFILVIGGGVIWMLRFRAAQSGDIDRASVRLALRNTGVVSIVAAVAGFGLADLGMERFGVLVMAVPVSMLIVGVMFMVGRKWV